MPPGMLDAGRVVFLLLALWLAWRQRFYLGIVFGLLLAAGFATVFTATYVALANRTISGEYAIGLLYVGPTTVPLAGLAWLPLAEHLALTVVSAFPAFVALRRGLRQGALSEDGQRWARMTDPFLGLFCASALLAICVAWTSFMLWREQG